MRALEAYIGFSMRGSTMNLACLSLAILLSQGLADEAYYSGIKEAFDPMYRLDYEGAIERITDLGRRFPEHPGPPLAQAVTLWVRELFRRQELDDLEGRRVADERERLEQDQVGRLVLEYPPEELHSLPAA